MPRSLLACLLAGTAWWTFAAAAHAFGPSTEVEIATLSHRGLEDGVRIAARMAWEVRKRSSVEPVLDPGRISLGREELFRSPFLYWRGKTEFPKLSDKEIDGLRRFVSRGGTVLIDDASAGNEGFDNAVRRAMTRAFPGRPFTAVAKDHTVFRSFYLLDRPVGRVRGPDVLEAIEYEGRLAVIYTRHDLGGAIDQDALGTWSYTVVPDGERQREQAIRLAVNIVLYALCLDYKDDQVHAPFIMRRRGNAP